MDSFPLVTVIVPTHNRQDFLYKTIQSIINQTYKNLQIIIVSNGVNINNKMVAQGFNDLRIEYYDQVNSGGPSSPRNHGIRKAQGQYIAFCDDDDLWLSTKVEQQVKILEDMPENGLCYTKMIRFDDCNEWSLPHEEASANFNSLLYINTVPISSIIIRKELLDKYGCFSEVKEVGTSEDYEFLLRYSLRTKFYFINDYLIKYWSGSNRTSDMNYSGKILSIIRYLMTIIRVYKIIYKNNHIKLKEFIFPILYNTKITLKLIVYTLFTYRRQ
jgi:teichuronic acid biosynthesis glycosyltransferase TuaG